MTELSRRGFLKLLVAAPVVAIAADKGVLWLPERTLDVEAPKELVVATEAVWDGATVAVQSVRSLLSGIRPALEYAPYYFSPGTPMLLVSSKLPYGLYSLRGDRIALLKGEQARVLLAWEVGKPYDYSKLEQV